MLNYLFINLLSTKDPVDKDNQSTTSNIQRQKSSWRYNDYYLCTINNEKNIVKEYVCSIYDSYEQADQHYKNNVPYKTVSTMFSVSHFMPNFLRPYYLKHKLANTFIRIKEI